MSEREVLEVDVLFVGAGPANLAAAYHLAKKVAEHNESGAGEKLEPMIVMIEKGGEVGDHILSGAVLDPRAIEELIPDFRESDGPFQTPVGADEVHFLTKGGGFKLPITPPPLSNEGKYVLSLSDFTRWLAPKVMELGVQIFPGFPGAEMLYGEGDEVIGVRTGDRGVNKAGERKPNFEPGIDIHAKVTVLGEGSRGSLCKKMFAKLGMHSEINPQVYAVGVKELWELPEGRAVPGTVIHTMGWPLRNEEFGGGFLYHVDDRHAVLGLVVGLDYKDPFLDSHERLQRLKENPRIAKMLEGGKLEKYGAASIPEGGYYSMPKLFHDGVLVVGDSAGFLNGMRLKGIHLGMKSGMLAAETVLEALVQGDSSAGVLSGYRDRFEASWAKEEMWKARNFHQAMAEGLWPGVVHAGLQFLSGGRGLKDPWPADAGHTHMEQVEDYHGQPYKGVATDGAAGLGKPEHEFAGELLQDKLTSVYHSDTGHEEDQPCHLVVLDPDICYTRCTQEYGNPCQHFCPANVYEMVPGEHEDGQRLQINFSNCVHCKTCDIMDPYQVIDWVTPQGGGGPKYHRM